jgi:hypothetical protein
VETAVKRLETIFTVDQYRAIMSQSVRNPKPTVTRMGDKFFDIHKMCQSLNLVKRTVDRSNSKIELTAKVRWIRVKKFGWYHYKHSLTNEEPWKHVCLLRAEDEGKSEPTPPPIEFLPTHAVPIKKAKLDDIEKQLRFIPEELRGFYLNLQASESPDDTDQPHETCTEVP